MFSVVRFLKKLSTPLPTAYFTFSLDFFDILNSFKTLFAESAISSKVSTSVPSKSKIITLKLYLVIVKGIIHIMSKKYKNLILKGDYLIAFLHYFIQFIHICRLI